MAGALRFGARRVLCDPDAMTDIPATPSGAPALLLVVDAANVVGSVPDGWWRDRRGAAERLRDRLAADGLPGHDGPVDVVLVVEGAARGVASVPGASCLIFLVPDCSETGTRRPQFLDAGRNADRSTLRDLFSTVAGCRAMKGV